VPVRVRLRASSVLMSYVKLHDLLAIEINGVVQWWSTPRKMEVISMASIQKRKKANGEYSYRVRIRVEGAPLVTDTFPTRTQALAFSRRMEAEIRAGRYFGKEENKEKTFSEFIDRYIEKELPKNPKGYEKQKMQLSWWKKHLGSYFLCHITPSMVAELRDKLMSETTCRHKLRTSSTTNRYIAALSRAFSICVKEWHWVKENPLKMITRPKENKARERYLEKEEIVRLLAACKKSKSPHLYAVTIFGLATGARKGEILGIRWKDICFERCTATFRDTKNGETRTVHLSDYVLKVLREERGKRVVLSEFVFPSINGKKPADIREAWERAVKEAGLTNVVFHTLWHTTASYMAMDSVSTLEIGKILGHKSLSQTKRYSHLSIESTAEALNSMNDKILGSIENVS
jgi:integrase